MKFQKGDIVYRECKDCHKFRILKRDAELDTWHHLSKDEIMAKFDSVIAEIKPQHRFRVGDKVKLVRKSNWRKGGQTVCRIGDVAEIIELTYDSSDYETTLGHWMDCDLELVPEHDWRDNLKPGDWVDIGNASYRIQKRDDVKLFVDFRSESDGTHLKETCGMLEYSDIRCRWTPPECPELPENFSAHFRDIVYKGSLIRTPEAWIEFLGPGCRAYTDIKKWKLWQDTWGKLK